MRLEDILLSKPRKKEEQTSKNPIKRFYNWSSDYINYKTGSLTGLIGGGIVYGINANHGFWSATGGFGKQFLYSLLAGGLNIRTCEKVAKKIKPKIPSLIASTLIPTTQAFIINYGIHKLGGTPEPFNSTICQAGINIPYFSVLGYYYQKIYDKKHEENET